VVRHYWFFAAITGLFITLWSSQLVIINLYGSSVPFWDQWDAEAAYLLIPHLQGSLEFWDLFAPHNEHRIFLTRVLALSLFEVTGVWNPLAEMILNSGIFALTFSFIAFCLTRIAPDDKDVAVWIFGLVLFLGSAPFGWENILSGFQSQFYLMQLFTLLGFYYTLIPSSRSNLRLFGWGCFGVALFTMSSGILAIAVRMVLLVVECLISWRDSSERRRIYKDSAFALVILVLGILLYSDYPPHEFLKANSFFDLLNSAGNSLSWPWVQLQWLGLIVYMPLFLLFVLILARRISISASSLLLVGLGGWVVAQALATGYARGGIGGGPASRYMDILVIGVVVNFCCLVVLARERVLRQKIAKFSMIFFLLILGVGSIVLLKQHSVPEMQSRGEAMRGYEVNVSRYVSKRDENWFMNLPEGSLPYPSSARLKELLDVSELANILPGEISAGLDMSPMLVEGFVPNGFYPLFEPNFSSNTYGSYGADGDHSRGEFRSAEIENSLELYEISFAGKPNGEGMKFGVETKSGFLPLGGESYSSSWKKIEFVVPHGDFRVVAQDESAQYWIAIGNLRQIAFSELVVDKILINASHLFFLVLPIFLLIILWNGLDRVIYSSS
jgi:hypothetical protein